MPSPPWFRFYSETLTDRKIDRVCRATNACKALVIGAWTTILALANDSPDRGALLLTEDIPFTVEDLAGEFGVELEMAQALVREFHKFDMIHTDGTGTMLVTNWEAHKPSPANRLYAAIFERDDYKCRYCGRCAEHVDHVIPRCQGGPDDLDNLVAACASCNLSKGGRTPEEAGMVLDG